MGDELSAEHRAERPDGAESRDRPQRPAAVVGRNPGQPQHRQRQQDGQYDGADNRADLDQLRLRTTDQGAQRLDPVPELTRVSKRVVRPVVEREHLVVDDLQDDHQREGQSGDHGHDASRGAGQDEGQRDQDEKLEREPHEPGQRQILRLVGSDQGGPHEQSGEDREHDGDDLARASMCMRGSLAGVGRSGVRGTRAGPSGAREAGPGVGSTVTARCVARRLLHSHHTSRPNDSASRTRATTRAALVTAGDRSVCGRDGQDDPLRRGDDLAPVARRQRLAHPRQQPPGGEEQRTAPRRSRAPRRPPSGRHTR